MRIPSRLLFILIFVTAFCAGTILLPLYPSISPAYAQGTDKDVFTGHVVAVTAGDTMDVRVGDDWTVTVRLHGVECPTSPRALRETATRYTSRLVLDTDVRVEVRGTASRSVVYGEVFPKHGGESVNFLLTRDGLATWASQYAGQRTDLADAESYAKAAQRGLWGADDGSNVTLPASAADAMKRKAAAAIAKAKAIMPNPVVPKAEPKRTPSPRPATPKPQETPIPVVSNSSPKLTPEPTPPKNIPDNTDISIPLIGGISVGVLTFLSLVAYGVAHGLPLTLKRTLFQFLLALTAAGLGAVVFTLPVSSLQNALTGGGDPTPAILGLIGPLIAVVLLGIGIGIIQMAVRLRRAAVDPRQAPPGTVKIQGTARTATGELARSEVGRIKGLYVREVTSRYTAEGEKGKRLNAPRWVRVRDTVEAVDFEIFSSAGDGTGSAVVLAAQDEELPHSLAPARWIPYHVARFYNEVPADTWFASAYEGDTRTEIFFVPSGATLTVWGSLHSPTPGLPSPRIASDSTMGAILICDGPESRAYTGRGRVSLAFGIGWLVVGLVCAGGAVWAVILGNDTVRQSAIASLAVGLMVLLVLAFRRGSTLAQNVEREDHEGESDPLRRPASVVWDRYQRNFPGLIIAPVVGD